MASSQISGGTQLGRDNEDLISCAKASGHIPLFCQWNNGFNNQLVVDGAFGLSGHDLPHGDATLFVGGIDLLADVSGSLPFLQLVSPPIEQSYIDVVQAGYDAFMDWDGKFKRKVGIRKPKYIILCLLWFLKLVELIFFIPRICFGHFDRSCSLLSFRAHLSKRNHSD
jgi:hypothetical protein